MLRERYRNKGIQAPSHASHIGNDAWLSEPISMVETAELTKAGASTPKASTGEADENDNGVVDDANRPDDNTPELVNEVAVTADAVTDVMYCD